jgi:hypothetical protein
VDIAAWLRGLGLDQYEPIFRDNDIDGDVLPSVTTQDLKDLGINSVGHRRRLLEAMNLLWHDGEMRELPAKCRLTIRRGDVFRHVLGGAGGWGDPAERDPAHVAHDVAEDKLSAEYARREYGMAIDPAPGELQCAINQAAAAGPEPWPSLPEG